MNIKKRLVISNTITILIPILITVLAASIFLNVSSKIFNKHIDYDNFQKLASIKIEADNISRDLSKEIMGSSDIKKLQNFLQERLSKLNGEFIITQGENVLYAPKNINMFDVENCIEEVKKQPINTLVKINGISYMAEVSDIKYRDGTTGNIVLLAPAGDNIDLIKQFFIVIIITFIISSVIVNIVTSYLFSKRIVKPIALLKKATTEISNGNLDCEIIETGDLEIEELCQDFEKMRIQLKDSVRMKIKYDDDRKILVSSISHDLKTPITSIKGYVEGILDGVAGTEEKKNSYLKTIYSKAEQMDGMIDDLLLYSKLDLNQIPFSFEKINIYDYFKDCIYECESELAKYNISIELINNLKAAEDVMLDLERMKRVIMNIIDNSRKYMDKVHGSICVMLRETPLSVIIEIRDNGSGISKKDIDNIFERFYRADSARSGVKGSGLGLAIAKQIVEGHNGKIWGISHGNEGTSILISLGKVMKR